MKTETLHYVRHNAQKSYDYALTNWRKAADGSNTDLFTQRDRELKAARAALCAAERDYPTAAETRRRDLGRKLSSRGLDR